MQGMRLGEHDSPLLPNTHTHTRARAHAHGERSHSNYVFAAAVPIADWRNTVCSSSARRLALSAFCCLWHDWETPFAHWVRRAGISDRAPFIGHPY